MKHVHMSELKEGDIFCYDVRLRGRKAFKVLYDPEDGVSTITCQDRTTGKTVNKEKKGNVILLRKDK